MVYVCLLASQSSSGPGQISGGGRGAWSGRTAFEVSPRLRGVDLVKPLVGGLYVLVDVGNTLAAVVSVALAQTKPRVGHLRTLVVNVLGLVEMLWSRILVPLILLPEAPVTDSAVQGHGQQPSEFSTTENNFMLI